MQLSDDRPDGEVPPTPPQPFSSRPASPQPSAEPPVHGHGDAVRRSTAERLDEVLLGGPRTLALDDLAQDAHLDADAVADYWRWLGLPVTDPADPHFTEADAQALREISALFAREELDERIQTTLVRSMGHTTERLALWQVEALVEHMSRRFGLDDTSARLLVLDRLPDLAPVLERQLLHAWRRQLAAVAGRFAVEFSGARAAEDDSARLPLPRAVGFADIVSFTKRTAGLGSAELAEFVQLFETGARDQITAAGGRVVKTIGDAVLFVADDPATGADVALALAEAPTLRGQGDVDVPPVRVSLVWGRVLSRFGDVFGTSVNLAARLTEIAEPSTVLVDPGTAERLRHDRRFALTYEPAQELQGLGTVRPVRLERA
ncbi:adenylate/guanylate cyclase domain-containing protein [Cellulomonas sp. PhB143]|uniref:adenylate/guanylate cyclase domain-containing protein n=1 Tax=Cellulomonas sp. PhB143 TaxID=2485186 RepID=UPI00351AA549